MEEEGAGKVATCRAEFAGGLAWGSVEKRQSISTRGGVGGRGETAEYFHTRRCGGWRPRGKLEVGGKVCN
jgi:hypothetical protein